MKASEPPERVDLGRLGERGLIRRIRGSRVAIGAPGVEVGIGDDTAVLTVPPGHRLLATTDLLIEDVHFRRASAGPADIGWKALAVNLSDIAAMGGIPRWALVALAVPAETEVEAIDAFYAGMAEAAAPHAVAVVGGDTSASPGGWMVNVTLLGVHSGAPRLRSDARPGDAVAVTGSLGASAAGLYALEVGPERALMPATGSARTEAMQLVALAAGGIEKFGAMNYETIIRPSAYRWPEWIERLRVQGLGALAALERAQWKERPRLDQVQISTGCLLGYLALTQPETLSDFPKLSAFWARCAAMSDFVATGVGAYAVPKG